MATTYVIPDIHGRFDLLRVALGLIEGHAKGKPNIVCLGDYIDRGPQSREVVELLMRSPYKCLKGNHEDMLVEAFTLGEGHAGNWIRNGGDATLKSFKGEDGLMLLTKKHLLWMNCLPLFHKDAHRYYVHAGISDPDRPLKEQKQSLLWHRYMGGENEPYRGKHVVHGHTPERDGPLLLSNRTNLDCGAVFWGRLVVGVFDDDRPGGPVEILEASSRHREDCQEIAYEKLGSFSPAD